MAVTILPIQSTVVVSAKSGVDHPLSDDEMVTESKSLTQHPVTWCSNRMSGRQLHETEHTTETTLSPVASGE